MRYLQIWTYKMNWKLANTIFKKNSPNIVASVLDELKVKHTFTFSNKYYNEHPYKNSLYGLSKILSDYQIENQGVRIKDKEDVLPELETPFIAYCSNDFVTVSTICNDKVEYIWKDKKITVPINEFTTIWSGVALLVEANEKSIEPGYKENKKLEFISAMKRASLIAAILLLFGIVGFSTQLYDNWGYLTVLLISSIGIYISYLLVLKQSHIHSKQADKICSLLIDKSDCNNILESDAAKFFGFSWSEIGLGYFVGNTVIITLLPSLYPYIALVNICALPYTIWSVWYQKYKAKQWCPLCLIVQGLLWIFFIVNLFLGLIKMPEFTISDMLTIGCIYAIPVLVLNMFIPVFSGSREKETIKQKLSSLKTNKSVFNVLLKQSSKYEISKSDSIILFGNPDAENLITVITNPHCNPCAKIHVELEKLLEDTTNGYCVQYILTSFNEKLEYSSKLFIAMYQQMSIDEFLFFLRKWYAEGVYDSEYYYKDHPFDEEDEMLQKEFSKHKRWIENTNMSATPTVLFNGYELPEEFNINELRNLIIE